MANSVAKPMQRLSALGTAMIFCSLYAAEPPLNGFPHRPDSPDVTLDSAYGLTPYVAISNGEWDDKSVDAHDATWTHNNSKNPEPSWSKPCNDGPLKLNKYPISIRYQDNFLFWGGVVDSITSQTSEWKPTYCNSAGVIIRNSNNATVSGIRINGAWDCVRFARNSDDWTLEHAWLSNCRDDWLENDQLKSGTVSNVLVDGTFSGISTDPGGPGGTNAEFSDTVVLDRVLIRMKKYNWRKNKDKSVQYTHANFQKGTLYSPAWELTNLYILYDDDLSSGPKPTGENRLRVPLARTSVCSDNHVLFPNLESGPVPEWARVFEEETPNCWTVQYGAEARSTWETQKQDWIDCHPNNPRLPSDPASDSANCDDYGPSRIISARP